MAVKKSIKSHNIFTQHLQKAKLHSGPSISRLHVSNFLITTIVMYGELLVSFGAVNEYPSPWCLISGLPIIGDVYEDFLPHNDILCDPTKYPPTVVKLLCIHVELCGFYKRDYIFCNWLLDHFYRGELTLVDREYEGGRPKSKKNSPPQVSSRPRMTTSNVTREGELAAFIAFWLSHFILPHGRDTVRSETCLMATLLAKGHRFFLAPMVLGYIYHMSHPGHLGEARATLPIHYSVELFLCLCSHCPDRKCPKEYPVLIRYAGYTHATLSLSQTRHVVRGVQFAYLWASIFLTTCELAEILLIWGCPMMIFDFTCSFKIVHIDSQLDNLSNESSKLRLKEQKILKEEERICKIQEDLTVQQRRKAKQVKVDLAGAGFSKLQDLEKEKDHPKNLIGSVISFNNV
ncbi:hypothetical protein Cgig2_029099 [Carnegiea gigantea]|uniref:Aminotransferase-like plant mobile domain-containing protein n=1 Tax=Carnegiea gigantea TaxID=171969 RepID=A0A9Q1GP95_9CARY|nr:hypothetical protein Cgig2_029099 [Carnegiea gigantea]